MSDLDPREQIVRIDRDIAETRKLMAERDNLAAEASAHFDRALAETRKFTAEQNKLAEEP